MGTCTPRRVPGASPSDLRTVSRGFEHKARHGAKWTAFVIRGRVPSGRTDPNSSRSSRRNTPAEYQSCPFRAARVFVLKIARNEAETQTATRLLLRPEYKGRGVPPPVSVDFGPETPGFEITRFWADFYEVSRGRSWVISTPFLRRTAGREGR